MPRKTRRKKSARRLAMPPMPQAPGNQQALMRQLEQMQSQMAENDISDLEFTASTGGGVVQVTGKGDGKLTQIALEPEILDPDDVEILQEMILTAVNDFLQQVNDKQKGQLDDLTSGMNLPPGLLG